MSYWVNTVFSVPPLHEILGKEKSSPYHLSVSYWVNPVFSVSRSQKLSTDRLLDATSLWHPTQSKVNCKDTCHLKLVFFLTFYMFGPCFRTLAVILVEIYLIVHLLMSWWVDEWRLCCPHRVPGSWGTTPEAAVSVCSLAALGAVVALQNKHQLTRLFTLFASTGRLLGWISQRVVIRSYRLVAHFSNAPVPADMFGWCFNKHFLKIR